MRWAITVMERTVKTRQALVHDTLAGHSFVVQGSERDELEVIGPFAGQRVRSLSQLFEALDRLGFGPSRDAAEAS